MSNEKSEMPEMPETPDMPDILDTWHDLLMAVKQGRCSSGDVAFERCFVRLGNEVQLLRQSRDAADKAIDKLVEMAGRE